MDELNALLKLNEVLTMNGYGSDFDIVLADKDFDRFVLRFEANNPSMIHYPEPHAKVQLKDINWVKIAGPGSYWHVKRVKSRTTSGGDER